MKYYNQRELGKICRYYRKNYTTYTQADVGAELYYSKQAIGCFERGTADTATMLQWYVKHGLTGFKMDEIYNILRNAEKL